MVLNVLFFIFFYFLHYEYIKQVFLLNFLNQSFLTNRWRVFIYLFRLFAFFIYVL